MATRTIAECIVLYVEDDDINAYMLQMAFLKTGSSPRIFRVTDGEQATAFLCQQGAYEAAPCPHLVLLDLNLPRKSGFDVLADMKSNPRFRHIPVVVFSSSVLPYDREKSLELGADDFLTKEGGFDGFVKAAETVCKKLTSEK